MSPNPDWNKGYLILKWSASLLSANALIFEHQKLLMLPRRRLSLKLSARHASALSREYWFYWGKDAHCVVCFLHFQMSYNSYATALRGIDRIVMTNAYGPHKIIYVCFFLWQLIGAHVAWGHLGAGTLNSGVLPVCVCKEGNCFNMHLFATLVFMNPPRFIYLVSNPFKFCGEMQRTVLPVRCVIYPWSAERKRREKLPCRR